MPAPRIRPDQRPPAGTRALASRHLPSSGHSAPSASAMGRRRARHRRRSSHARALVPVRRACWKIPVSSTIARRCAVDVCTETMSASTCGITAAGSTRGVQPRSRWDCHRLPEHVGGVSTHFGPRQRSAGSLGRSLRSLEGLWARQELDELDGERSRRVKRHEAPRAVTQEVLCVPVGRRHRWPPRGNRKRQRT